MRNQNSRHPISASFLSLVVPVLGRSVLIYQVCRFKLSKLRYKYMRDKEFFFSFRKCIEGRERE